VQVSFYLPLRIITYKFFSRHIDFFPALTPGKNQVVQRIEASLVVLAGM